MANIAHAFGHRHIVTRGSTGQGGLHLPSLAHRAIPSIFDFADGA